jgi:ankyrin repeat protein
MADIWTAVKQRNLEQVNEFLEKGADVNAQNPKNDGTLFHYAAGF